MRRCVAVLVLLLSVGSAVVAQTDPVDDFINEQRKSYDLPGDREWSRGVVFEVDPHEWREKRPQDY